MCVNKFGVPSDKQLEKVNKLSRRKLDKDEVFVFPSKLAGDMIIPGRNIQLTKPLLDVFSRDANKGVSLLLDHSWAPDGFWGLGGRPKMAMPYGRTFDSRYEPSTEEGETVSLVADHYMIRGVELDGIKTDDLIASVEAGTLFDSSIGFSYDKATCSVCEKDYRSRDCDHISGKTYEVEEEDGVVRNKFCYIKAEAPGFLMENSLVFDGAYPGAGVMSKAGDIVEGENGVYQVIGDTKNMDPEKPIIATYSEKVGLLTMVKKSNKKKIFKGVSLQSKDEGAEILKGGEKNMNEEILKVLEKLGIEYVEGETSFEDLFNQLADAWKPEWGSAIDNLESGSPGGEALEGYAELKAFDSYITEGEVLEELGVELSANEVLRLAKEGQDYHVQVIEEAIAMGVRAQGNEFAADTWKETFGSMSTKAIKDIMKTFESQAKEGIASGRLSNPKPDSPEKVNIPDDAFVVGK